MSKVNIKLGEMYCKYGFMPPIHAFMPPEEGGPWGIGWNDEYSYAVFTDENNKSRIEIHDKNENLVEVWDETIDGIEDDVEIINEPKEKPFFIVTLCRKDNIKNHDNLYFETEETVHRYAQWRGLKEGEYLVGKMVKNKTSLKDGSKL